LAYGRAGTPLGGSPTHSRRGWRIAPKIVKLPELLRLRGREMMQPGEAPTGLA
jgi:hypothetical protein